MAFWRVQALISPRVSSAPSLLERAERAVRSRLFKLGKQRAVTPAGLFAKAVAVAHTGSTGAMAAISLADDLLNSAELRRALWPATNSSGHDADERKRA